MSPTSKPPRHHKFHLVQELAFAGFLETELEVQGCLFHELDFLRRRLHQAHR